MWLVFIIDNLEKRRDRFRLSRNSMLVQTFNNVEIRDLIYYN